MGYVQHHAPNFFDSSASDHAYEGFISSLRGLGQDREDRRRQDIQDARQRASEDFTRRQSEAIEARQRANDERERRKYELEISDRNRKQAGELYDTAVDRPTRAAAMARAAVYVDPKTGEQRSVDFDPGGEETHTEMDPAQLQDPNAAPAAPPRTGLGAMLKLRPPGAPPEQPPPAGGGGEEDAMGGQPSGMQPRGPVAPPPVEEGNGAPPVPTYGGLSSALKLAPPPPQVRTTTTMRKPSLGLPGGGRVQIDTDEGRRARAAEAGRHADELELAATQTNNPKLQEQLMTRARLTRAEATGAEGAQGMAASAQTAGQDFKAGENAKYNTTAEQKFKIGMRPRAASGAAGEPGLKEQSFELRDFNSWVQANKIKDLPPMARRLTRAMTDLASDKPLAHRSGALDIAGIARGGVPQDTEQRFMYDAIQNSIAGWSTRLQNQLANGDFSDELMAQLHDAAGTALASFQSSMTDAAAAAKKGLHTETNPRQRDRAAAVLISSGMDPKKADEILGGTPGAAAPAKAPEGTVKAVGGRTFVVKGGQWVPKR
jgi:hypothetical protein